MEKSTNPHFTPHARKFTLLRMNFLGNKVFRAALRSPRAKLVLATTVGFFTATRMTTAQEKTSVFDFEATSIDGQVVPLSKYRGDVTLIVNVASR